MLLLESAKRLVAVLVLGLIGVSAANLLAASPLVHDPDRCAIGDPGSPSAC